MLGTKDYIDFRNAKEFIGEDGTPMTMDGITPGQLAERGYPHGCLAELSCQRQWEESGKRLIISLSVILTSKESFVKPELTSTTSASISTRRLMDRISLKTTSAFSSHQHINDFGYGQARKHTYKYCSPHDFFKPYKGVSSGDDYATYDEDLTLSRSMVY